MRRHFTALVAAPALLLGACSGDGDAVEVTPSGGTLTESEPRTGDDPQSATTSVADDAAATTRPSDGEGSDDEGGDDEGGDDDASTAAGGDVEGGPEGQAAADRAKEFLIALVDADPAACDLMLSFSDPTRPMADVADDLELCRSELPETMAGAIDSEDLGEEGRSILEAMQITGADVDGGTAVIDQDNYSDLFADSMGRSSITLVKIDDAWFIDVERFLQNP